MIDLNKVRISLQAEDSPLSLRSKEMIRHFYKKLVNAEGGLTSYKSCWLKEFTFIYGEIGKNPSSHKKIRQEELAGEYGMESEDLDLFSLFYAIQTFFSLFMKIITYKLISDIKETKWNDNEQLLHSILFGRYFEEAGVKNYCYPDWFCWIGNYFDPELENAVFEIIKELNQLDSIDSLAVYLELHDSDQIKQIYETMIPHSLRHALGEFYTPDWLAKHAIKEITVLSDQQKNGESKTWLDPACGSGTFLFQIIQELRSAKPNMELNEIISSVKGFDVNPIAVLTAKTTYLIAIIDLINKDTELHLPIFNYDVIHTPVMKEEGWLSVDIYHDTYEIPLFVLKEARYSDGKPQLKTDQDLLMFHVKRQSSHQNEIRRIIAYILLNRLEAYKLEKADLVIGNPPWVNWEYLPKEYREKSQHLWTEYGLFSRKGRDLSFAKEDISILITYIAIDKFLKSTGHLAFVIKQGIFKSEKNGIGFRRFQVGEKYFFGIRRVDDLSRIRPFEKAAASTAVIFLQKNEKTQYPVPWFVWRKKQARVRNKLGTFDGLDEVFNKVSIKEMIAFPLVEEDVTSIWITIPKETAKAMESVLGTNPYRARTGVFTGGANAVYWLDAKGKSDDGAILISNIVHRAKRKVEEITTEIEPDFVYPIVKGSNISQWEVESEHYLLLPHTSETKIVPIKEEKLEREYPKTLRYLLGFKPDLDARKGFAGWERQIQQRHFHALLRIGEYTFSPYKVAWRYIATEFITAVISSKDDALVGEKLLIPNEKVMYISLEDEAEAYYVCGILSSDPIAFCVKSYMNPISISTHVLEKINIAPFQVNDPKHRRVAELCKLGHAVNDCKQKQSILSEINHIVADIYGLSAEQMKAIHEELTVSGKSCFPQKEG